MQTHAQKQDQTFEEDAPRTIAPKHAADALLVNIEGFEGPMEVLLELARNQKVDLMQISILELVRQYLGFVERAKALNLKLASEYLVTAAWLAYLKSRLLLPQEEEIVDHTAEDMAEALQFQLKRLESMQKAAEALMALPQLGQQVFTRGAPEGVQVRRKTQWNVKLYDLLKAYGDIQERHKGRHYDIPEFQLMSTDNAMNRLIKMLGGLPRKGLASVWTTLESFMPEGVKNKLYGRSAMASTFTAGLELAKQGRLEIRQDGLFRPVYMRGVDTGDLFDEPQEKVEG